MKKAKMNIKNLLKGALLSGLLLMAGLIAYSAISTDEIADNSAIVLTADMNSTDNFVPVTNDKCGDDKAKKDDKAKEGDDKAKSSDKAEKSDKADKADAEKKEGKCGEGKCSGDDKAKSDDKAKESKCGEGKCGEGKCG